MGKGLLTVYNKRTGAPLGNQVLLANNPLSRIKGLLGRRGLRAEEGLLIKPCSGIHTWFMRFPIDVAFLDRSGMVIAVRDSVPPFRMMPHVRGAYQALELPPGLLEASQVCPGDPLQFVEAGERPVL